MLTRLPQPSLPAAGRPQVPWQHEWPQAPSLPPGDPAAKHINFADSFTGDSAAEWFEDLFLHHARLQQTTTDYWTVMASKPDAWQAALHLHDPAWQQCVCRS